MVAVTVIAGVLAVVVLVGSVYVALSQGLVSGGDSNPDPVEREQQSPVDRRDEWTVPVLKRYKAWPASYRIALTVIFGFLALWIVGTWQLLKGTLTMGTLVTPETWGLGGFVVGGFSLVRLKQWSDNQTRSLTMVYEQPDGSENIDEIHYKKGSEHVTSDGTLAVKEVVDNRVLGLFYTYKQVAAYPELRKHRKLPEDVVRWGIPDHAVEVPDGYVVRSSSDGKRVVDGPDNIDYTVGSPEQMSYPAAMQIRRENRQLRIRAESRAAEAAELEREVQSLKERLQNEEYTDREALIEDLNQLAEPVRNLKQPPRPPQQQDTENPAQQAAAPQNGGDTQ